MKKVARRPQWTSFPSPRREEYVARTELGVTKGTTTSITGQRSWAGRKQSGRRAVGRLRMSQSNTQVSACGVGKWEGVRGKTMAM